MSIPISQYIPPPLHPLVSMVVFDTCDSISSFICSIFLNSTYKWYCIVFVFLFLSYFTLDDNLWVHLCHYKWHYFIPFYGWVINHFVHSSVDGHLGCFHVVAVVNNAAMKAEVHASFQIMVFLQLYARSGTAGLYGRSSFKRSLHIVLHSGGNTDNLRGFLFLHSLSAGRFFNQFQFSLLVIGLFIFSVSSWCSLVQPSSWEFVPF